MSTKLRNFSEQLYKIVDECDDRYSAVEGIEDYLKEMPITIKEGIANTQVEVNEEGIVVEPRYQVVEENEFYNTVGTL